MSVSAISYKLFCFCDCFVKGFCLVHCKYRRKFLMCKLFTDIYRFNFTDQDLCFSRDSNSCHLSDGCCFLSNDLGIPCTIDQDCFSYFLDLIFFKEVASSVLELCFYCFVYALQNSYRLLRSTDHTIVECLGMNDGVYCKTNVCCLINDNRCISGSNTKCRFSGGVCSLNHSRTTCCKDDVSFFHYKVCQFKAWYIDPSDDAFRSTCFNCRFQNNLCSLNSTSFCTWMWADDNRVSCF